MFTPEDTEEVLAFFEVEDEKCPGCGQPKVESFDPRSEGHWTATSHRCHSCVEREHRAEDFDERAGLFFTMHRDPQ